MDYPPLLSLTIFLSISAAILTGGRVFGEGFFGRAFVHLSGLIVLLIATFLSFSSLLPMGEKPVITERYQGVIADISFNVDGISALLILLTAVLVSCCLLWASDKESGSDFCRRASLFLFLESAAIGAFASANLFTLYLFFESSLIPMILIMCFWGGENRKAAAIKMAAYTIAGSLPILIAIAYMRASEYSLEFTELGNAFSAMPTFMRYLVWVSLFIGFAVKIPIFPLHLWLPDAHVEASATGSAMLAGIMLKIGGYGILRTCAAFPESAPPGFIFFIMSISMFAIIYASLIAWIQTDIKKAIAYSSIAHMGMIVLGLFSGESYAVIGSVTQMITHGITSAALFLCVGSAYERLKTRELENYSGFGSALPDWGFFFLFFSMSAIGLPGLFGFVGEFMILAGTAKNHISFSTLASSGVLMSAIYMLGLCRKSLFGIAKLNNSVNGLRFSEKGVLLILVVFSLLPGIFPSPVLSIIESAVADSFGSLLITGSLR